MGIVVEWLGNKLNEDIKGGTMFTQVIGRLPYNNSTKYIRRGSIVYDEHNIPAKVIARCKAKWLGDPILKVVVDYDFKGDKE